MGLSENLIEIKSEADALLTFANQKTGVEDISIGDAIKTLADRLRQGGDGLKEYKISILGDGIIHTKGKTLKIPVPFEPFAFECHLRNYEQTYPNSHTLAGIFIKGIVSATVQRSANTTVISNGGMFFLNVGQSITDTYTNIVDYSNGVAEIRFAGSSKIMLDGEYYDFTLWGE